MTGGFFVTFEGLDGCGKTTQCRLLTERLKCLGITPLVTREPGGTPLGVKIRQLLLESELKPTSLTEALLFAADRAQHVEQVVRPALQAGQIVLCDRYTDSTMAYQGYGRQRDLAIISQLIAIATGGLKPDLTFLFELSVEESQQRLHHHHQNSVKTSPDRLDSEALEFHYRVYRAYQTLAVAEPERFCILDASQDIETLHHQVWEKFREQQIKQKVKNGRLQ